MWRRGEVTPTYAPYNADPFLMRVLLTRPLAYSQAFEAQIKARFGDRVEVAICPMMEIVPLPAEVDFAAFDALIFTSQNGVAAFERLAGPRGMTAYCVGDRTADAAREIGLKAVSANGDVAALNAMVGERAAGAKLLHLSGADVAGAIEGDVTRIESYEQRPLVHGKQMETLLIRRDDIVVPLFSPQAARWFGQALGENVQARLHAVCMSEAVARQLDPARFQQIRFDGPPTSQGMLDKMSDFFPARPA